MNRRLGLWLSLTLLLFTAACSSGSSSARPPSTPAPTSRAPVPPTTQPAVPPTTQATEPVGPDGVPAPQTWLGIIDDRGSVVAVTPDGGQRLTFSPPADVGRGISSSIPSWSHDGSRLAWTETNRAEGPSVVTSRVDRRETTRDPLPLEPFYVSW
ncbi:MAG: hypothetical protein GY713_02610, partial [Actinomycetia bacterium]|nr:hypothetical protein [Actinomycetes bacterium]